MYAADLAMREGKFIAIAAPGELGLSASEELDATGSYVLPGVIDGHVHFREPGLEYKEDFGTGSRAAVMGGVTTVLEMPNTIPPTANVDAFHMKRELAEAKSHCDFGLLGLLAQDNLSHLAALAGAGVVGFKCFLGETIGKIPAPNDGVLIDSLAEIATTGLRVGFHAENDAILQHNIAKLRATGRIDALAHVESRPVIAEVEAISRVAMYAQLTGAKVHIFHLSSRDGLDEIERWRLRGVDITCETGAHYCFLTSQDMQRLGSVLRMNPPVRGPGHHDALLAGLVSGAVTTIATDHSPHTREEKVNDDIWKAISGFAGVELSVRLFLTYAVNPGRMTLPQFVRASSEAPAKTWGLYPKKGTITVGSDGDLTIVNLAREGAIRSGELHSKNNTTPFDGQRTRGEAIATVVRGRVVMREGQLVGTPQGKLVRPATKEPEE
jgi:allantoinase